MKKFIVSLLMATSFQVLSAPVSIQNNATSIRQHDQALNARRQATFLADQRHQHQLLEQSENRLQTAEKHQQQLKATFAKNEKTLTTLSETLRQRSGELGQVFDVLRGEGQKFQQAIDLSLVSAQTPLPASAFQWVHQEQIPSAADLRSLATILHQQLQGAGAITHFKRDVITPHGQSSHQQVIRIGEFELFNQQGDFLNWQSDNQSLQVMGQQPGSATHYLQDKTHSVLIDPTRGQLLKLAGQLPSIWQRVQQGGVIGYVIIALGCLGLLIALYRLHDLIFTEQKVNRQLKTETLRENNPLGRVLSRIPSGQHQLDELELLVDEAVSQELPRLERSHTLVKLFAGVTPLLGLLGTVTGMIATFQSITLFGTGDPKMMASGISQALMTTVLGLIAAIPLLFAHNLLTTRARRISQILQQQTLALLADRLKQESEEYGN
ncbi:MotA/TolQ/ExbB proton channel family protein [Celerinatantimonas sp. YJH-8]|uniref:MotA/TolQ/ExbB proton channel family protein n=1 Tax=Celerinatantimonas sp. YJH-8 TaxID=3228714 RepID=UPI0038C297D6